MARDKELDLVDDDDRDEDEEEEEIVDEFMEGEGTSGIVGFIGGLFLGALIGAGVALLVAPERGDVTRRRLRKRVRDVSEDAREQLGDWRGDAERELRKHRRKLQRRLRSRSS